jgi:hypothetical protein
MSCVARSTVKFVVGSNVVSPGLARPLRHGVHHRDGEPGGEPPDQLARAEDRRRLQRHGVAVGAGERRRAADAPAVERFSPLQFTALQLTLNRNSPLSATKKGRRSSKNDSYAVRLSTAGSASTWPKSG